MEVDAGGTGEQVSDTQTAARRRAQLNIALYLALVLLACGSLALVLKQQQSEFTVLNRAQALVGQDEDVIAGKVSRDKNGEVLHTSVLQAATAQALAMANFDYREPEAARDKVLAGATGELAEEYEKTFKSLRKVSKKAKSVLTGRIVSAGIVAADQESATVIVALTGTVENVYTDGVRANSPTMRLELQWKDDRWLTSNLIYLS